MSPPHPSGAAPNIGVVAPEIFDTFASSMKNNNTAFREKTAAARSAEPGTPGPMSGSQALMPQLDQATALRTQYIDATAGGIQVYQAAMTEVGAEHRKLHSAMAGLTRGLLTVHSSKGGGA